MAQQIINNGESGLTVRGKLNDNFTELYTGKDAVTVNTFADLPAPGGVTGQKYWVLTSTGVYLINRRNAGSYYSDGAVWTWLGNNPSTADQIGNVPAGGIAATDVQAALNELDTDKLATGGTAASATQLATGRTIAITGDLTYTSPAFNGTGNVTAAGTIPNDTVTFAKMQNSSAASILLGRGAGSGAGDFQEIVLGTNLSMTGTTLNATGGGGGGSPGGSTTQVQYNNAGAFDGAANVTIDASEYLVANEHIEFIAGASAPSTPASGRIRKFVKNVGGRLMPAFKGPSGLDATIQPHTGLNRIAIWQATGNATTITSNGVSTISATGTPTIANVANTNAHTMIRRVDYLVTTPAVNAVAGVRGPAAMWSRGAFSGFGGFHLMTQWGPATGVSTTTTRAFSGLRASTAAPTDVEPSTLVDMIGMGWDAADTNIQMMHNDSSGTATKIDLGASFPVPTVDRTNMYEVVLFASPADTSQVQYRVTDIGTGAVASGSITTNLPATTVFMTPLSYMSVGGTSSAIGLAFGQTYIESDF